MFFSSLFISILYLQLTDLKLSIIKHASLMLHRKLMRLFCRCSVMVLSL